MAPPGTSASSSSPETAKGVKFMNVVLLGIAFMFIFTAFQTMGIIEQTIIASIKHDHPTFKGNGYISLSILYVVFALSNWLAPLVVYNIGGKFSMIIGGFTYLFFIASFLKPHEWLLYLSSGILGLGASMLWCGQGMFLTKNSDQDTMGRNSGIFWALLQCSLLFGNIYVYAEFTGDSYIGQETRQRLFLVFLGICAAGVALLCFLRRQVGNENVDMEPTEAFQPVPALAKSYNLLFTQYMALLTFTFLYTGFELSFLSGVFGTSVGFTEQFGDQRKSLVGLTGIFIGLGEIVGGAIFGIFGARTVAHGRDPIVLIGMLVHLTTFFMVFLVLPNDATFGDTPNAGFIDASTWLVILCAFGLGFGDSCYNTQLYSLVGRLYSQDSAAAFAIFKFMQSLAAAAAFAYSNFVDLYVQLGILVISCFVGSYSFWSVEWSFRIQELQACQATAYLWEEELEEEGDEEDVEG